MNHTPSTIDCYIGFAVSVVVSWHRYVLWQSSQACCCYSTIGRPQDKPRPVPVHSYVVPTVSIKVHIRVKCHSGSAPKLHSSNVALRCAVPIAVHRAAKATLVFQKQRTKLIPAAAWIAAVDRRTPGEQSVGLRRTAIVLQGTQQRVSHRRRLADNGTALDLHQVVTKRIERARACAIAYNGEKGPKISIVSKFPARIVFWKLKVPELKIPPPVPVPLKSASDWLFVIVALNKFVVASLKIPPPNDLALFPLTVLLIRVSVAPLELEMPPPSWPALFPLTVLLVSVNVPPSLFVIPPPPKPELFPVTALLVSVNVPVLRMPPPTTLAVLPLTVLLDNVTVPSLRMPPPLPRTLFPLTVLLVSVNVPPLKMPPPRLPLFPLTVLLVSINVPKLTPLLTFLPCATVVDAAAAHGAVPTHRAVGKRQCATVADAAATYCFSSVANSDSDEIHCDSAANIQDPAIRAQTPVAVDDGGRCFAPSYCETVTDKQNRGKR